MLTSKKNLIPLQRIWPRTPMQKRRASMKSHKSGHEVSGFRFRQKAVTRALYACAGVLIFAFLFETLSAQESRATLEGRITDQQGAVVPKASIEVISQETEIRQRTTSNAEG